eukprot:NODE_1847_length_737_cov_480.079942_g1438_i0.p1 GENE.NODE_1847_length_737_cov_480.079942_g1438_i0~~NODE_1847_length_737_cov_480.079942_g1438_i0.p1  ORF type:complete len:215 (+),score=54.06 NODE_1847_length_737_cov_480.079942_g1438_i0:60-647(+)
MADKITIEGPPEGKITVGKEETITLTLGEGTTGGPLNVAVKSEFTPKPLEVKDTSAGKDHGEMVITFVPRATGKHTFELTWGPDAIPGTPLELICDGEVVRDASKVEVKDIPAVNKVNEEIKFAVAVAEEAGPGPLHVDASGPSEATIELTNEGTGQFSVCMKVSSKGTYKVGVYWGDSSNPVPGSPFEVAVAEE